MNCLRVSVSLSIFLFLIVPTIYGQNVIPEGGPTCGDLVIVPQIEDHSVQIQGNTANVTVSWRNNGAITYELTGQWLTSSRSCTVRMPGTNGGGTTFGTSSCTLTGIPLGNSVDIVVRSSRACTTTTNEPGVEEVDSDPITVGLPPAPPTALVSSPVTITSFKASWSESTGATGYQLDVIDGSTSFGTLIVNSLPVSGTSQEVTGLSPNREYNFLVRAVNPIGASANSSPSSITIHVPTISAFPGSVIKYEQPNGITLTTEAGRSNYTWSYNSQQISGASTKTLQVTKAGVYAATWCVSYSDGTTKCFPSNPFTVAGETMTVNYVQKRLPQIENVKTQDQLDALAISDLVTTTDYADGFVRPIQHVERGASPLGKDIVTTLQYDVFGRTPKQFLPFTRKTDDGNYMYMPHSTSPILNFYQQNNDNIANTTVPFAETIFENSPLNRILNQGAPGEDWQVSNGHAKSITYGNNSVTDKIWLWTSSSTGLLASGYYASGTLVVTSTADEDGHVSREFKNKTGQVVVSERVIEGNAKLRTYFVFDDMGRLTHVVPPITSSALPDSPSVSIANNVLARECFTYQYDNRSRQIVKNIPGAGPQFIVYDKWDRVVLTQHANQRTHNKWSFIKYDAFGRVIMTGEVSLQADQAGAAQTVSDFYASIASNPTLRYEDSGGTIHGYTNRSFPIMANANQAFTVSYYDNYDFLTSFGSAFQFSPDTSLGLVSNFSRVKSLITGSKVLILGTTNYLKSAHYYDKNHRLIQVISDNHLGRIDMISNLLDFTGKITKVKMVHNGVQLVPTPQDFTVTTVQEFIYDPMGRKLKVYHTVNNGPRILLCQYRYNELGQMVEKNLHSTDGNTFLQSEDYAYNIRGWLSQMNPTENESNVSLFPDQFGFELSYTNASGISNFQQAFSGNIGGYTEVRATDDMGTPLKSAYGYHYDARSQLTQASYYQLSNSTKNGLYDMPAVTYDANGNIETLQRKGITRSGTPGMINDFQYFYDGNQLINVNDHAGPPTISSFSPTSGPSGSTVTITGTKFHTTLADNIVKFNGVIATVTAATATQLIVTVPATTSTGTISVTVDGSTITSSVTFTVTSPTISSFSPTSGVTGTTVTITGTNFHTTLADNIVKFNGVAATVTAATTTQLTVTVPATTSTGIISVTVNGITATSSTPFTIPGPTITSFSPAFGRVGATVTITGTNFHTTLADNIVKFNGVAAAVTAATAVQLTVTVPTTGSTGVIRVTVDGQTVATTNNFQVLR